MNKIIDKKDIKYYLPYVGVEDSCKYAIEFQKETGILYDATEDYIINSAPKLAKEIATDSNNQLDERIYKGILDAYGFCLHEVTIYKQHVNARKEEKARNNKFHQCYEALQDTDKITLKIKNKVIKEIEIRNKKIKKVVRIGFPDIRNLMNFLKVTSRESDWDLSMKDVSPEEYRVFSYHIKDIENDSRRQKKIKSAIEQYIHWPTGAPDPTLTPKDGDFKIVRAVLIDYFSELNFETTFLKNRFYGGAVHQLYRYIMDNALYKNLSIDAYNISNREVVVKFIIELFQLPDSVNDALQYIQRKTTGDWLMPHFPLER